MVTNFYVHKDAICYNGEDSEQEVLNKFHNWLQDISIAINPNAIVEPRFFVSDEYQTCLVSPSKTIVELVSSLPYEECNILCTLLGNTSMECSKSIDELHELSKYSPEETECNVVMVLNSPNSQDQLGNNHQRYIEFDKYDMVYDGKSYSYVCRQILGNHSGDAQCFVNACKFVFPNLLLHDNCVTTILDYLNCIPRQIVYCLSCLNDCFYTYRNSSPNRNDPNNLLTDFAAEYGIQGGASLQGNSQKKPLLTYHFTFTSSKGGSVEKQYLCEPHLKIDKFDSNYKPRKGENEENLHARIYFHFGDADTENRLPIGSIGPHVE